jgi:hypothetical protein
MKLNKEQIAKLAPIAASDAGEADDFWKEVERLDAKRTEDRPRVEPRDIKK